MRRFSAKEKISLIMTLIFFFTTLGINVKNLKKDIKYISSTEINNKYNSKDNNKGKNSSVKEHISNLWDTLGKTIDYLEVNIDNKEKLVELEGLIDDSIIALNSIEDALNKNYKNAYSNLVLYIKDIRNDFINLREELEKDEKYNIDKNKVLKNMEQNYIKFKKEKDF
ncbi:hypothetical protein P9J83_05110 [Clostridium sporogenes]|uniref:Uncharacterized protein n=1 Tax=Clostridium sporogenes TaxID=1509 RepID=A0AAE4FJD7_CLOSG|nr:hypothetical protein [Clostridium sporogenes]MDS1002883.1 hypothetical protein [Clostridium sporogenes]